MCDSQLLLELLGEVHRLVSQDAGVELHLPTFLDVAPSVSFEFVCIASDILCRDDEQNDHAPANSKRRAIALLVYCDHVLRQQSVISSPKGHRERTASSELLASLLPLAINADNSGSNDVATAARAVMASTLRVMSATDFLDGVLSLVTSADANVSDIVRGTYCVLTVI